MTNPTPTTTPPVEQDKPPTQKLLALKEHGRLLTTKPDTNLTHLQDITLTIHTSTLHRTSATALTTMAGTVIIGGLLRWGGVPAFTTLPALIIGGVIIVLMGALWFLAHRADKAYTKEDHNRALAFLADMTTMKESDALQALEASRFAPPTAKKGRKLTVRDVLMAKELVAVYNKYGHTPPSGILTASQKPLPPRR